MNHLFFVMIYYTYGILCHSLALQIYTNIKNDYFHILKAIFTQQINKPTPVMTIATEFFYHKAKSHALNFSLE